MSLNRTCQLCGANSFDYLTELPRQARDLAAHPAQWMARNCRETPRSPLKWGRVAGRFRGFGRFPPPTIAKRSRQPISVLGWDPLDVVYHHELDLHIAVLEFQS